MRIFGYPPAWIEEAKLFDSGLSLFVDKDKKQLQDEENDTSNFKYDVQKIHEFPGFNVVPDHPYIDMHRLYQTPPMMPQHSKEELIRSLGDDIVNGYKKTKLRELGTIDLTDKTSLSVADMEIEDDAEVSLHPLGVTVYAEPPIPSNSSDKPPEPMEDGELSNDSRSPSPNESELKEQRQALLAEIAESSVFFDTSSINSSIDITNATTINHSQLESTIIENSENENRDNVAKDTATTIIDERAGHVDSTIFGCPVLPSFSGHSILPDGEKFQEGVCDVINFENLAESTGAYERMKNLIKKVRVFQSEHQKE
jgi:zinc finger CCHC domain-containing protein 8